MKNIKIAFLSLIFAAASIAHAPNVDAQITLPDPFVDFSGIFIAAEPLCLNGLLVEVLAPVPLVLLVPYVPITPIVPVFKLWGPVPGSSTLGNFFPGGVCLTTTSAGIVSVPVTGTVVQIGTTAAPTPWYLPITFL